MISNSISRISWHCLADNSSNYKCSNYKLSTYQCPNLKLIIWGLFEHEIFHHYYKTHNNLHSQNLNLNLIPAIFKLPGKWRGIFFRLLIRKCFLLFLLYTTCKEKKSFFLQRLFVICFPSGKHMFVLFSQICFIYYPMKNKSFQHALKSLLSDVLCNCLLHHFLAPTKSYIF